MSATLGTTGRLLRFLLGLTAALAVVWAAERVFVRDVWSAGADELVLSVSRSTPNQPGLFFPGDDAVDGGAGVSFGDGLRCAGGNVVRLEVVGADATGVTSTTAPIAATGNVSPGDTKRYQWWYRDAILSPCGNLFNLSNGLEVTWAP